MNSIVNFDHNIEIPPVLLGFIEEPFDYLELYEYQNHFQDLDVDQLVRLISGVRTDLAFNFKTIFSAIYWDVFYASEGMSEERILLEANEFFQQYISSYIDWIEWRFRLFQATCARYGEQSWAAPQSCISDKIQKVENNLSQFTAKLVDLTHELRLAPVRRNYISVKMIFSATKKSIKKILFLRIPRDPGTSIAAMGN